MTVRFIDGAKNFSIQDISYIESHDHMVIFHFKHRAIADKYLYATLDEIESKLSSSNLIRTHQSYLVNSDFISTISNYKITLNDGTMLNASRTRYNIAKEKYQRISTTDQ